jgi:hypothetical protein
MLTKSKLGMVFAYIYPSYLRYEYPVVMGIEDKMECIARSEG